MPSQAFRGERLKLRREQMNLTQTDLAERISAGQNQIYRYEKGETDPSAEVLARLATELAITTDWLLGLVDEPDEHLTEEDLTPDERKLLSAFRRGDWRKGMTLFTNTEGKTEPEY